MKKQTSVAIIGLLLLFPSLSYAGVIPTGDSIVPGPGASIIDGGLSTTYWNNDNGSNSNWEYIYNPPNGGRQFSWVNLAKEFTNLDPIDIQLSVDPSEGTTEYLFVENIYNNTGENWTDYHVLLGVGIGDDFESLTNFGFDFQGLDFDTPDADPAPAFVYVNNDLLLDDPLDITPIFATLFHGDQELTFQDGVFASPNIKPAILAFSFDVPDLGLPGRIRIHLAPISYGSILST